MSSPIFSSDGSRDWPPVRQNWSPSFGFPQIIWLAMRSSKLREWTELEVKTLISMTGGSIVRTKYRNPLDVTLVQ